MNTYKHLKALVGVVFVSLSSAVNSADITTVVDLNTPSNDQVLNLDLSRLLPIANNNTWNYDLYDYTFQLPGGAARPVLATIGERETIGGGCLELNPIVFGDELVLYLGNYGDSLSLYGIYLEHWMGMNDVLFKFETRSRVEWLDFMGLFYNEQITPVDQNSCQDTGRGVVERTGLVLLEDLTENLGVPTNQTGVINCRPKNSDLRDFFVNGGQHGSGLATIAGVARPLYWNVDSIVLTDLGGGSIQLQMDFRPKLGGSSTDYSMYIDMTLVPDQGITNLSINSSAFGVPANSLVNGDLIYTQTAANHVSPTNSLVPGGTCPEDTGRFPLFISFLLFVAASLKKRKA